VDDAEELIPVPNADELLEEWADITYVQDEDGWVVLATAKKVQNAEPMVLGRGATREEAETNARQRALIIYGGAALAVGALNALKEATSRYTQITAKFEGRSSLAAPARPGLPLAVAEPSWRDDLPPGARGAMAAWILAVDVEDGVFRSHIYGLNGQELIWDGQAETWDDAILAAIENLPPPSGEG
jgi:hypothetical protein